VAHKDRKVLLGYPEQEEMMDQMEQLEQLE
jgi:hypothetical protein